MKATPLKSPDTKKTNLAKRLSRIRGQVDALQRAILEHDASSAKLLQQARACRGAMDGFIAEVIEDQIREVVTEVGARGENAQATEELIGLVHTYLT
jgi:DNA-binding FrmR family transcriptional regulator